MLFKGTQFFSVQKMNINKDFSISLAYTPFLWLMDRKQSTIFIEQRNINDKFMRRLAKYKVRSHHLGEITKIVSQPDDSVKPANFILKLHASIQILAIFAGMKVPHTLPGKNVLLFVRHDGKYKYCFVDEEVTKAQVSRFLLFINFALKHNFNKLRINIYDNLLIKKRFNSILTHNLI